MEGRTGNTARAAEAYKRFARCKRDWLSDEPEIEQGFAVLHAIALREDGQAVEAAQPFLRNARFGVAYRDIILAVILAPLMRMGRAAEAMDCHRCGYKLVQRNPRWVHHAGEHMTFLALTDNLAKAQTLLGRHLPVALTAVDVMARFDFFLAARLLLDVLRNRGCDALKVRLPETFPLFRHGDTYPAAMLTEWLDRQLTDLAGQFDARNGNDYFRRRIDENNDLKRYATVLKVPTRQ
jgi:hypothetical protein